MKKIIWNFALSWPEYKEKPFISWLKQKCKSKDMSFLWIHDGNIGDIIKGLESGKISIQFLFDMNATYSVPYDKYAHLCYAVKDRGGKVLNDPDDAKAATDKSVMHYDLMEAGIPVPFTVVIRKWSVNTFKLTETERKNLKIPFIIKPSSGFGKIGVIPDATTLKALAKARNYANGDNILLQEKIEPIMFGNRRGWFRVFYVFNEVIPCWWDTHWAMGSGELRIDGYEQVTMSEMQRFKLFPLVEIVVKIAELTNMKFFTTEIAIHKKGGYRIPVAIDYVNDQCDLDLKSQEPVSPPDEVIEHIIERIVECAWDLLRGEQKLKGYSIWFAM